MGIIRFGRFVPQGLREWDRVLAPLNEVINQEADGSVTVTADNLPPQDAQYVTLADNSSLPNDRVLAGTAGEVVLTDNGATAALSLADAGTAGTYTKVTTDAKGRVTVGTVLEDADIPDSIARDAEVAAGYQPLDADLTAIAALASAADKLPYATGAQAWSLTDLTSLMRSLLADATSLAAKKTLGVSGASTATYVSGTGTAGTANTAMTILTRTFPANSLAVLGDRVRIRVYFFAQTASPIVCTCKLGPAGSEVAVADITHTGGTASGLVESWLHYIDNTHLNIIEQQSGTLGNLTTINVAGFVNNAQQNIIITQDAVSGNYVTVYGVFVDLMPLAVA